MAPMLGEFLKYEQMLRDVEEKEMTTAFFHDREFNSLLSPLDTRNAFLVTECFLNDRRSERVVTAAMRLLLGNHIKIDLVGNGPLLYLHPRGSISMFGEIGSISLLPTRCIHPNEYVCDTAFHNKVVSGFKATRCGGSVVHLELKPPRSVRGVRKITRGKGIREKKKILENLGERNISLVRVFLCVCAPDPQQGNLGLSGFQSRQGANGGARTRNQRVPADLRANSLATVQPIPLKRA
ncbi:hypothetical protein PoB_000225500 [Plakobranchus ocellatus]|uniref:Uncharacterized protein n=1 Tax=Plakobranchus ocellatus TaxID=259542 RepID=A0AAV3XYN6_9GAST|nr:hypothetical protein PoB_000225500 [Plakobranchus ocellatus]